MSDTLLKKPRTIPRILRGKQLGFVLPIAILIAVVLIVVGGVGYYFYKTSQEQKEAEVAKPEQVIDETADWKIYRNEKYEFEVKYPKGWIFEEKGSMGVYGLNPSTGKKYPPNLETIYFGISPLGVSEDTKTVVSIWDTSFYSLDQLKLPFPHVDIDIIEEKKIYIDKGEAWEITNKPEEFQKRKFVIFKSDTRDIIYTITNCEPEVCSQIFSTFKFIER